MRKASRNGSRRAARLTLTIHRLLILRRPADLLSRQSGRSPLTRLRGALLTGISTAIAAMALAATPSHAADARWIGPADGNWFTPGNWSTGVVPAGTGGGVGDVYIVSDGPVISTAGAVVYARLSDNTANIVSRGLVVGANHAQVPGGVAGNGTLTITGAGYLTVHGNTNIGLGNNAEGVITVTNGGTLQSIVRIVDQYGSTGGGINVVSSGANGKARLVVSAGGKVIIPTAGSGGSNLLSIRASNRVGEETAEGSVLVTGAGSEISTGRLQLNGNDKTELLIEEGGKVSATDLELGFYSATVEYGNGHGHGRVIVSGEGSQLNVSGSGNGRIGDGGYGTLIVRDGATATFNGRLTVGDAEVSNATTTNVNFFADGTVTVTGDGSRVSATTIWIAKSNGKGTVTVENGGRLSATGTAARNVEIGVFAAGDQDTANGIVTLADGGTLAGNTVGMAYAGGKATLNIGAAEGDDARGAGILDLTNNRIEFGKGESTLVFNHDTAGGHDFGVTLAKANDLDNVGTRSIRHLAGLTTYSGDGSGFDGLTSVLGGSLLVTGQLGGAFNVASGATLGGTGTIGAEGLTTTIASGGTLSPGLAGQIGPLNVAGNLVFEAGSTYAVDIKVEGGQESDKVNVAGTATLNGAANVVVNSLNGETAYTPGQFYDYTILSAAGGLTNAFNGSFSTLFLEGTVQNAGNDVVLSVKRIGGEPADPNNPVWTGANGGNWFTAGNWNTGVVPDSTNYTGILTIANGGGPVVDQAGATAKGTRLNIGSDTRHGALTITGDGHLTSHNTYIDSGTDTASSVTVTNGGTWRLYELRSPQAPRASALRVGATGKGTLLISAGGQVIDGSTVTVAESAGSTGEVTVTGENSLLAASALTVSGGGSGLLTVLDKGKVTINNALQVGYANGGNGQVRIDGEGATVQAGTISIANSGGNGSVLVENGGKLVLTATAGNPVNIGYGPAGTGTLTLADGGTLQASRATIGFFGGKGILNIGAAEGQEKRGAGVLDVAEIAFGSGFGTNDSTLVFNHTETDYVLNTTFSKGVPSQTNGSRAIRHLAGVTTYGGNGSAFDGTTTVLGGTLLVTDRLSGVFDVSGTGVLGGTSTIGTADLVTTIASGGTLAPGLVGRIGTLNVAGDLTFAAGSNYAVHINADRESDKVVVAGTATISNEANVRVSSLSGETFYEAGETYDYTILTAGTLNGAFNGGFESLFLEGSVANSGNDVVLSVQRKVRDTNNPTWTGDSGGDWFDEDNWDTGIVPDSTNFTGTLTIATGGPVIDTAGATAKGTRFDVGKADGQGSLTITGDGHLTSHNSYIDSTTDEASSVTVTNGGTWRLYELRSPQAPRASALRVGDVGKGALLISAGGRVIDGSTVTVAATAGSIGEVTVTGENSLLAASALTVSGGGSGLLTVLDKGKVTISNAIQVGYANGGDGRIRISGDGSIVEGGTIHIANSGGNGSVLVENGGKLVLTATAGNPVNIGYGPAGTGTLTLADGGTLQASRATIGFFGGKGILNIGAAEGQEKRGAGVLDVSEIAFGSGFGTNDSTLVFNHTETDYVLNATFSKGVPTQTNGSRAIRHLAGVTTYGGNGSAFDGTTTVLGGTLLVTDRLSGVFDVSGTGVLGGSGTIGTADLVTTIASGGTLAPGLVGQIDTLNVAGDLTFAAGSNYAVHINADRESDKVVVAGTATISNEANVRVSSLSGETFYEAGETYDYTILTAGTLDGSFAGTPAFNALFLEGTVRNEGNDVVLAVTRKVTEPETPVTFEQFADTANQVATARALDTLETALAGRLMEVLTTEEQARDAYDQLSGDAHASTRSALIRQSHFLRDAIGNRLGQVAGQPDDNAVDAFGYAPLSDGFGGFPDYGPQARTSQVWASAFGSRGTIDSDGNAPELRESLGGLLIGADETVLGNWHLGALVGYGVSQFETDRSSGNAANYHIGAYAGGTLDAFSFRSALAYSLHDVETSRNVAIGAVGNSLAETLNAAYAASTLQAFGEVAYRIDTEVAAFEPFANLAHVRVATDGFTETGGTAALSVQSDLVSATFAVLGVRASTDLHLGEMLATLRGSIGWQHAFGDVAPTSTAAFAGSDAFTVTGAPLARDMALVEAGLDLQLTEQATFGVSWSGQFGAGVSENSVKARLNVRF